MAKKVFIFDFKPCPTAGECRGRAARPQDLAATGESPQRRDGCRATPERAAPGARAGREPGIDDQHVAPPCAPTASPPSSRPARRPPRGTRHGTVANDQILTFQILTFRFYLGENSVFGGGAVILGRGWISAFRRLHENRFSIFLGDMVFRIVFDVDRLALSGCAPVRRADSCTGKAFGACSTGSQPCRARPTSAIISESPVIIVEAANVAPASPPGFIKCLKVLQLRLLSGVADRRRAKIVSIGQNLIPARAVPRRSASTEKLEGK